MNEHDVQYYKDQKRKLLEELEDFPSEKVFKIFHEMTGRYDLSTGNLFCLTLMLNVLKTKFGKSEF